MHKDFKLVEKTVKKVEEAVGHNKLGRMISLNLRHNVPREQILQTLSGIEGDNVSTLLTAVRKFLGETIKDGTKLTGFTCPKCSSQSVKMEGGCFVCIDCGDTNCGM